MYNITKLPQLPQLQWVQTIRDPIWGEIPITEVEKKIVQTEAFYRLRGIKQLSFAYLAFPGAVHSRFEHSLGVMHATDMLLKMVRSENENDIEISSFHRQLLRLAALLHDIGHPPFSHVMENLFSHYPDILENNTDGLPEDFRSYLKMRQLGLDALGRHEFFTEYIICKDEDIGRVLAEWVESQVKAEIPKADLPAYINMIIRDALAQLAVGGSINPSQVPGSLVPLIRIFKSIVSGDIDADKIDYLMRDNYYCGLPHKLDITSLRHHLILKADGLEIDPEGIDFVHSLILARYSLITKVHQEMWGVFTTAKVIELLHDALLKEQKPANLILEIFTKWDDSRLLAYLFQTDDPIIKSILVTQYPLRKITHLENIDTHPHIREGIQILSERRHHYQIPKLQNDLRTVTGNKDLFIHVHTVKSPEFSMKLSNGGDLLRDQILRGISEESFCNLSIAIYGDQHFKVDFNELKTTKRQLVPCEECAKFKECLGNLENDHPKRLLAELTVCRYRQIAGECGAEAILCADYLLIVMEKIKKICEKEAIEFPIRQAIYKIAQLIAKNLRERLEIRGNIDLKKREITSTFDQEIRKYEQMGLIAYSREIRKLPSESGPSRNVFRFDRRFQISAFGQERLDKVRRLKGTVPEYDNYLKAWEVVETEFQEHNHEICEILRTNRVDSQRPLQADD
jgi:HD superfamily phosphohydrolase